MKFLVDAQLSRRLAQQLRQAGVEATHTYDLPLGNCTPDAVLNELSVNEQFVVVTKDADFVNSFHLHRKPWKLLLGSTGNIKNVDLDAILLAHIVWIAKEFETQDFIEINRTNVIVHS